MRVFSSFHVVKLKCFMYNEVTVTQICLLQKTNYGKFLFQSTMNHFSQCKQNVTRVLCGLCWRSLVHMKGLLQSGRSVDLKPGDSHTATVAISVVGYLCYAVRVLIT